MQNKPIAWEDDRYMSLTKNFIEYEKLNPKTRKFLDLKKDNVILLDGLNHDILQSKRRKDNILKKTVNAIMSIVALCQSPNGVI